MMVTQRGNIGIIAAPIDIPKNISAIIVNGILYKNIKHCLAFSSILCLAD